jgi:hypothetical protein
MYYLKMTKNKIVKTNCCVFVVARVKRTRSMFLFISTLWCKTTSKKFLILKPGRVKESTIKCFINGKPLFHTFAAHCMRICGKHFKKEDYVRFLVK